MIERLAQWGRLVLVRNTQLRDQNNLFVEVDGWPDVSASLACAACEGELWGPRGPLPLRESEIAALARWQDMFDD